MTNSQNALDPSFMVDAPIPTEDGTWISPKVARVAELLTAYDWHLEVKWIPPAQRAHDDPAFAICYTHGGCPDFVVMYVQDESEMDERVLQRIYAADNGQANVLNALEAHNKAVKDLQRAKYEDALAEANDLAAHIWKSKLNTYKHDGIKYQ
jgi:hypothetical protein